MKTSLIAVALVAFLGLMANRAMTPPVVQADVESVVSPVELNTGSTGTVTVTLSASTDNVTISVDPDTGVAGVLEVTGCTPACAGDVGNSGASVVVTTDNVTEITLNLTIACTVPGFLVIEAEQGATSDADTTGCIALGQVVLTADPNLLPCEGGVTELTAVTIGPEGDVFDEGFYDFKTTAGLLKRTGDNTAELTLGPNQTSAVVTATTVDEVSGELVTAQITVNLACNNFATVVVTANPNVIPCGGTSIITATARDANGHVVPGVGFHFATNTGLLIVQPNHAANESGIAALTLQPGMPDSTVIVSVGGTLGTVEQTITVQNFCPGQAGQHASIAPGQVVLNSSNNELVCGEQVFVGMRIRDLKGQVPPDGTAVSLLATSGLIEPPSTTVINGTANVIYTAPNINGDVRITAAAGDAYGYIVLKVKCSTTTTGTASAPCRPIGDGVCITPPNTGSRITPPNTGEAGLK